MLVRTYVSHNIDVIISWRLRGGEDLTSHDGLHVLLSSFELTNLDQI